MENINVYIGLGLGVLVGVGFVINYFINSNIKKNWVKKQVIITGIERLSPEFSIKETGSNDSVCFYVLAKEVDTNQNFVYKSEMLCSEPDDIWLNGKIDGLTTSVYINPKNPEKYKLDTDSLPPSQYS